MMKDEISHIGRIASIDPLVTQVEITRADACDSCRARELCGHSSQEHRVVSVPTDGFAMRNVGDEVELCMKRSMGMKAVWISYVIPLVLLMATVLILSAFNASELVMGLSAIAVVALYYLILMCFKDRLGNEFEFYIK